MSTENTVPTFTFKAARKHLSRGVCVKADLKGFPFAVTLNVSALREMVKALPKTASEKARKAHDAQTLNGVVAYDQDGEGTMTLIPTE